MWQEIPYHIDPVLLRLGSVHIRYYGLMYCVAFCITYYLSLFRIKKEQYRLDPHWLDKYLVYAFAGVIIGARLGFFLFYEQSVFLSDPLSIVLPIRFGETIEFTGFRGMSFHGGLIGVVFASILFSKLKNIPLYKITDLIIPAFPLGYMFGRLGNFFNSELYGRLTTSPVGMYFSTDPDHALRHPSQLYEAFGEGLLLFIFFWSIRREEWMKNRFFPLYLICYGMVRFIIEFFRQPDPQIGYLFRYFTLGQFLCFVMILAGSVLLLLPQDKITRM